MQEMHFLSMTGLHTESSLTVKQLSVETGPVSRKEVLHCEKSFHFH